jgi:hypothetical protein
MNGYPDFRWKWLIATDVNATHYFYEGGIPLVNKYMPWVSCTNGQLLKNQTGGWVCANDIDTTQTLSSSGAAGNIAVNISGSNLGVTCQTITGGAGLCDGVDANSGGTVTGVTGTDPIVSSEGTAPAISLTLLKDVVTTAPLTGGVDNILPGADSDVTLAITMLGDLATTAPITGAASNIFPGTNGAKATIALTLLKDLNPVTGSGIVCAGNDILPGADADVNIGIDSSILTNWTGANARYTNQTLGYTAQLAVGTASFNGGTGALNMSGNATVGGIRGVGGNVNIHLG